MPFAPVCSHCSVSSYPQTCHSTSLCLHVCQAVQCTFLILQVPPADLAEFTCPRQRQNQAEVKKLPKQQTNPVWLSADDSSQAGWSKPSLWPALAGCSSFGPAAKYHGWDAPQKLQAPRRPCRSSHNTAARQLWTDLRGKCCICFVVCRRYQTPGSAPAQTISFPNLLSSKGICLFLFLSA